MIYILISDSNLNKYFFFKKVKFFFSLKICNFVIRFAVSKCYTTTTVCWNCLLQDTFTQQKLQNNISPCAINIFEHSLINRETLFTLGVLWIYKCFYIPCSNNATVNKFLCRRMAPVLMITSYSYMNIKHDGKLILNSGTLKKSFFNFPTFLYKGSHTLSWRWRWRWR